MTAPAAHLPIMTEEVVEALAPRDGARLVDGTFGRGGHAAALLEADRAFLDAHLVAPCGSLFVESRTRAGSFIASDEVAEELRELGLYARLCDASGAPLTFDRDTVEPAVRVAHAMAHMLIEHPVRCLARVLS